MRRDLDALGRSMVANTEAQRRLHPALVGLDAQRLIDLSRSCGALGWKVNGAGGDGGSLTVLSATAEQKMALEAAILESAPAYRILPVHVSEEGVTVRGAP
jgi:D-glycero-alpha-D-manno-heptose-7-phosphate kinase